MLTRLILALLCLFLGASVHSQISLLKTNGNIGLGTVNPQHSFHFIGPELTWENSNGADFITFQQSGNRPLIRIGGANNGRLISRHIDGKNHRNGNLHTLYLQYFVNKPVIIGRSDRTANYLKVFGDITSTGVVSGTQMNITSDERLKANIKKYNSGIDEVLQLEPIVYNYKGVFGLKAKDKHIGLSAQNLQKVAPLMVEEKAYILEDSLGNVLKSNNYLQIVDSEIKYLLINAIKEQQGIIDNLEERIAELENISSGIEEKSIVLELSETDEVPVLLQNSPNPTNNTTSISYNLPQSSSNGVIRFYSLSGTIIKEVEITQTGNGSIEVDISQIPSGNYMYTLIVDGALVDTKTMAVVK